MGRSAKVSIELDAQKKISCFFLVTIFLMSLLPLVLAQDTDGDGVVDSSDDCELAYGTSTS